LVVFDVENLSVSFYVFAEYAGDNQEGGRILALSGGTVAAGQAKSQK